MNELLILVLILVALCVAVVVGERIRLKYWGRRPVPMFVPRHWRGILEKKMPMFLRMPLDLQEELLERVLMFVEDKDFEACGGLDRVTEEMEVVIAAYAQVLQLNKSRQFYARLRSVLVYPDTFVVDDEDEGDLEDEVRVGESWETGSVILSWRAVEDIGKDGHEIDGKNVAIHEFAHQIDQEFADVPGVPVLDAGVSYREWAKVLRENFEDLQKAIERGEKTDLDEYGAEDAAEFFSVVTEAFYEDSAALREKRPELYSILCRFYKMDPACWRR